MTNTNKNRLPELLAPAGTPQAAAAAIAGGADAIYAGLPAFNARMMAENFTRETFTETFELCREYGVKVYAVVNTLVKDGELADAMETLAYLNDLGIDGVIIQDPGLIRLARLVFPDLKLQVSTQLTVYGIDGVRFFEKLGFTRAVMPREMSIAEAGRIRARSDIEIKIFGHGALCYAYSGQCRFSSALGTRSGNRGRCAQPCRKKYELTTENGKLIKEGYLLSTRDLSTLPAIPEITGAGIDSIKIEGRLKSPEYVYAVTSAYREALDSQETGEKVRSSEDLLKAVFSRGFTGGGLYGSEARLTPEIGKRRGFHIGKVGKTKGAFTELILKDGITLVNGDGIAFGKDEKIGTSVSGVYAKPEKGAKGSEGRGRVWIRAGIPEWIRQGENVYRSLDHRLMKRLKSEASRLPERKSGRFDMSVIIQGGSPVAGTIEAGGVRTEFKTDIAAQPARTRALTGEEILTQLGKTGGTGWEAGEISISLGENLFLPKSELNRIRTTAIAALDKKSCIIEQNATTSSKRAIDYNETIRSVSNEPVLRAASQSEPVISVELPSAADAEAFIGCGAGELLIPAGRPEEWRRSAKTAQLLRDNGMRVLLTTGLIVNTDTGDAIRASAEEFAALLDSADGFLVKNYELLEILKDLGRTGRDDFTIETDDSLNLFNTETARFFEEAGVSSGVLSTELSGFEQRELAQRSIVSPVLSVYGRKRLMTSAYCVFDCPDRDCANCVREGAYRLVQNGEIYPLRVAGGLNEIYDRQITLLDREQTEKIPAEKLRLTVTDETPEQIEDVVRYYRGSGRKPEGEYIAGSFDRGVL